MEERLKRVEESLQQFTAENRELLTQLRTENKLLREEIAELSKQMRPPTPAEVAAQVKPASVKPKAKPHHIAIWVVVSVAVVSVLFYLGLHLHNPIATTAAGALTALAGVLLGPAIWQLLILAAVRAIPNIVFGQAAKVYMERWKNRHKAG